MNADQFFASSGARALLAFLAGFYVIIGIYSIVAYIFQSIGLYSIAKRRGIAAPGLAWVPIGTVYIIGKIADQVRMKCGAEKSNFRKWLLGLGIATCAISIIVTIVRGGENIVLIPYTNPSKWTIILIFLIVEIIVGIVSIVLQLIALFHIYRSCSDSYVTMTVLSIIFSFLIPFFL